MPGSYRYEEERNRGQRGTTRRGGFGERGRDDDIDLEERERYGPSYGREQGVGRFQGGGDEGTWRRQGEGRDYGRSSGGRGNHEGFEDEEDRFGTNAGVRETPRYAGGYRQGGYDQGAGHQGGLNQGGFGEGYGLSRYGQSGYEQSGYGQGVRSGSQRGQRGGSQQADGWTAEPDEMKWGRQQGLYGSSEYGGYISSQRSQKSYQSHVGKGPKGWQRSDERIREDVCEALARHPEVDASDIDVKVQNCEVTLTGNVTEREAKRIAEDVVERVFGVKDVQNQIKVKPDGITDREVTRNADRDARTGREGQEAPSWRASPASTNPR